MEERYHGRLRGLMVLFLLVMAFFVCRLAWLQIVEGSSLAKVAARYHSRTIYYRWGHGNEGRGLIFDRNLKAFTEANLVMGLAVFTDIGKWCDDYDYWLGELAKWSGLDSEEICRRSDYGRPLTLLANLPVDELPHWIVPVLGEWDGEGRFRRNSFSDLACHVLGFTQPPYPGEENEEKLIGRLGVERYYDSLLRCDRPGVSAFVDAKGRLIAGLGYRNRVDADALPNVVLSLDISMQAKVENIFDDYIRTDLVPPTGTVVVMEPHSGHILAMCSRPVIRGAANHCNLATRKSASVDMEPLASLVKVVTAAAALEKDPQLVQARFTCTGSLKLGANTFVCSHGPHGEQDLAEAMANSCNIYFAQLAAVVGAEDLLAMARAMGLGDMELVGLPACEVSKGNLPEPADLATAAGLANNFAFGSNKMEGTPLQVAVMLSTIANGGWRIEPRLVLTVNHDLGQVLNPGVGKRVRAMNKATAQGVARLMRNVVVQGRTGYFDQERYPLAGAGLAMKTGTSDTLPPAGCHLSWCGGFYPWQNPEYVVVYMGEVSEGRETVARGRLVAEIVEGLAELAGAR